MLSFDPDETDEMAFHPRNLHWTVFKLINNSDAAQFILSADFQKPLTMLWCNY